MDRRCARSPRRRRPARRAAGGPAASAARPGLQPGSLRPGPLGRRRGAGSRESRPGRESKPRRGRLRRRPCPRTRPAARRRGEPNRLPASRSDSPRHRVRSPNGRGGRAAGPGRRGPESARRCGRADRGPRPTVASSPRGNRAHPASSGVPARRRSAAQPAPRAAAASGRVTRAGVARRAGRRPCPTTISTSTIATAAASTARS